VIAATGGPAWQGQTWTITPADTYGIERVHAEVSPSPREGARLDDGGATLIWELAEYNSWLSSGRSLAVALLGCNFPMGPLRLADFIGERQYPPSRGQHRGPGRRDGVCRGDTATGGGR